MSGSPATDPAAVLRPHGADRLVLLLATGLGVGRLPASPGTFGSLWGLPLAMGLEPLKATPTVYTLSLAALLLAGVPICGRAARLLELKDPGPVVYDEFASLPLAFIGVGLSWPVLIGGFLLFRLFDIWKPWPLRRMEQFPGGWGIMADDMGAALLAGVALWLLTGHAGAWF